jgi:4-amino-4-deoxy-L-arabinose transferase-like glycosyltransferase
MRAFLASSFGQSCVLVAVCAALMLPNLGVASLWDVDEGVNAEAAREMMETGTWIVPTFNYELRTQKPVFLYWVQRASYNLFGVTEWAARFPAVLFSTGTVLVIASLGRRMFGPAVGMLAGVILATTIEFCKLAHAATPDAPLIFFVTLTLSLFWTGHEHGKRTWFYTAPLACGLAVLTKGPAFFGLIGLIILSYLLWGREWRRLWDARLISGLLIFLAVTTPWYGAVAAETKGAYIRAFLGTENIGRFSSAMEGHSGWPVYYIGAILAFFAPWSVFLFVMLWDSVRNARAVSEQSKPYRFLLCWFGVILLTFSCAATKLPNYIATLYPALALLTANFLIRWSNNSMTMHHWIMPTASISVGLIGVAVVLGFLIIGGTVSIPGVRIYPNLAPYAALGLCLLAGACGMGYSLRAGNRDGFIASLVASTVLFVGFTAALPAIAFEEYKAPRSLVADAGICDPDRDISIASYDYIQPSATFYAQRKVIRLVTPADVVDFLAMPRPGYVFIPESKWSKIITTQSIPHRIAARRFDFLRNEPILVVTNERVDP